MKNIFTIFATVFTAFTIQSCEKFLDLKPVSTAATGNSFITQNDMEAALVAAYNTLHCEYYTWDNILLEDVRSDNAYAGPPDDVDIYEYDLIDVTSSNARLIWNWRDLYNGVARCNVVLTKVDLIAGIPKDRVLEMKAEARFLRALYYFDLVKSFGAIPIVESTESADPEKIQLPQSTVPQVYDFILKDLEFASNNLPVSYGADNNVNKARATKGAAHALTAKVWAQSPDRDYSKVIQYCDSVINSPAGYKLLSKYKDLFDGDSYNNVESIMEIQFIGGTPQGNWGPQLFLPPSLSGDGWRKYCTPSTNLINGFTIRKDWVRHDASIKWEKVNWVDEFWNAQDLSIWIPFAFKFKHADGWNSGDQIYLLRLADILLLKAEAMAVLQLGDYGRSIVNQIRDRVDLNPTTAADAQMLDAVMDERRFELVFEAQRWSDLRRTGKAVSTMKNLKELNLITGEYIDYNATENTLILPIPITEIDRNPKLHQNLDY